ncbi:aliphatic amidase [Neisseria meningitidis]|nr:aliphatic amidase [Neisseria meningitidis]ARC09862.1 aliphatic amidase [Neisseria meningitidis]MBG8596195.1 aliphatic amidase [Neisseria meningitidis]MBG8598629.1 aliphatic amidase [Neisseria meningitidis]MBG8638350.1 aliphatic amidase [Neisseria meningitidis]
MGIKNAVRTLPADKFQTVFSLFSMLRHAEQCITRRRPGSFGIASEKRFNETAN